MSNKIQIKRGLKANLPVLDAGEPAFTTDTKEFFVGDGTSNVEFAKQEDLEIINNQVSDLNFQTAGGTGTSIILTINQTMTNGLAVTFIASANNGGAVTTINGKALYKPNTTTVPNLIAGKAYTVWYNSTSDCFFIKASAEGNTIAAHVLAGDTFSNDDDTGIVGTMSNNGAVTIVPGVASEIISKGYHNGSGIVKGDANLVNSNIKSGVSIFGVSGKPSVVDTADATATAGQILNGKIVYINGSRITGSMPQIGYANTPQSCAEWGNGDLAVYLATSGYYVAGSGGGTSEVRVPVSQLQNADGNLRTENIISGKSIFGVNGTATLQSLGGKRYATNTTPLSGGSCYVTGLPFSPTTVVALWTGGMTWYFASKLVDSNSNWETDGTKRSMSFKSDGFTMYNGNSFGSLTWYAWE